MNEPTNSSAAKEINIMLVAHTNVGKTTLVRTLLGKDVGEVLDAPDVTKATIAYDLVVDPVHGALRLWDTPGFGDSFRLAKRLRQKSRFISWLVREFWDRYRNPRLWRNQLVAQDLRTRASVILYMVNSMERPGDAIYVEQELSVLEWIGKPVLAILNQNGDPKPVDQESANIVEWRNALAGYPVVSRTLVLDSYTRCWLQELALIDEIGHVLKDKNNDYLKLAKIVHAGYQKRFDESIDTISEYLVKLTQDKETRPTGRFENIKDIWGQLRKKIPWGKSEEMQPDEPAMRDLAQRFMEKSKSVTDKLIVINRLNGVSASEIFEVADKKFTVDRPADQSSYTLAGGVISGALTGLGADLLAGGLTLGAGALVGGLLGSIGAAALAKGYNIKTKKDKKVVSWSQESLIDAFKKSIMLYLAIAHFGRGQGEWRRKEDPEHWGKVVDEAINKYREQLVKLWTRTTSDGDFQQVELECPVVLRCVLEEVMRGLYPEGQRHIE